MYVADTHAVVFFANRNRHALSQRAWEIFEQAENRQALILIPAPALWEASNLERMGRIELGQPYAEWTRELFANPCFDCIPLDAAIIDTLVATHLPSITTLRGVVVGDVVSVWNSNRSV